MKRDGIQVNDRQLVSARINSEEGQNYLKAMCAAGNYAWVNRSSMTFLTRQVYTRHDIIFYSFILIIINELLVVNLILTVKL